MDDGVQDVDPAADENNDRAAGASPPPRRGGLVAWLFERRPERSPNVSQSHPATETGELSVPRARPRPSGAPPKIYNSSAGAATAGEPSSVSRPIDDASGHNAAGTDEEHDGGEQQPDDPRAALGRVLRSVRKLVIVAGVVVVAALLLRSFVVAPYYVPSASMEPTLHGCPGCNNDHVLVEKLSYLFHDVQAGDIVVFHRPDSWQVPDDVLVKRVIGVAGDRLTIKNGRVYRNGQVLTEPYVNQLCTPATTAFPGSPSRAAKTFPFVPNGDLFVMGDNRCDSDDSRVFGVVPSGKVIGRAFVIIYPFGRVHSL